MPKVTINGKDYDTETMPKAAKDNMTNVKLCDDRILELQRDIAITQTARNTFAQALKAQLPKDA
ncbi:hypothetical protein [Sulfitobacter geojensis]|uniref:hypothetical protein n=1 Tax=Sulfitobacter geojensis TaxID=1342299 RepID=UPI0036DAD285